MICQECKQAGLVLAHHGAENGAVLVRSLHGQCRGGTQCDCAHQLEGTNRELLKRQAQEASK